jgi:hypothetical protein
MKAFCDPAGAPALADQAKDFELAVGEHGQGRVLFERSASEKFLGDAKKVRLDLGAKAEKRTITLENDSRRLTSERRGRARRLPPAWLGDRPGARSRKNGVKSTIAPRRIKYSCL